ncbi:hypothetical protein [Streptomyces sp. NPDC058155]|uniref:hypothetical protein n=1 Tax=Streptomyces sp. NPDC058155 TaxID=3346359 RepID=UPI0036E2FCD7
MTTGPVVRVVIGTTTAVVVPQVADGPQVVDVLPVVGVRAAVVPVAVGSVGVTSVPAVRAAAMTVVGVRPAVVVL